VPDDQKPAMVGKVTSAISRARSLLNGAGYKGKIVTVDTLVASRAFPALCKASDYCAVNCHPFFDGGVGANAAGMISVFISSLFTNAA
jgi:exo-beta-1,3-glucanase (GH17 family)